MHLWVNRDRRGPIQTIWIGGRGPVNVKSGDIGGTASTSEFADAICRAMEADAQ